jgi:hypothetical protein
MPADRCQAVKHCKLPQQPLNTRQQLTIAVGLAVLVLMGIFPPWLYVVNYRGGGLPGERGGFLRAEVPMGYHFIFTLPPLPPEHPSGSSPLPRYTSKIIRAFGYPRIDYMRLLVQWLGVAIFVAGVVYLLGLYPQAHKRSLLLIAITPLLLCTLSFLSSLASRQEFLPSQGAQRSVRVPPQPPLPPQQEQLHQGPLLSWDELVQSDAYQALAPWQKLKAKRQYAEKYGPSAIQAPTLEEYLTGGPGTEPPPPGLLTRIGQKARDFAQSAFTFLHPYP